MKKIIEKIIFNAKWLLIPFYFGLIVMLSIYGFVYAKELVRFFESIGKLSTTDMMLKIFDFADIVMIANLLKMIIAGSYNSFVSKDHGEKNENVSSGTLKVKMNTSILGIVTIHLLKSFTSIENIKWEDLNKQLSIAGCFVIIAMTLSIIDYLHEKSERQSHENLH